jgi:hypothetical protein
VVTSAHQAQFNLILNIFYVEGAATGPRSDHGANHRLGKTVHGFPDTRRRCALGSMNSQEGLHHRDSDLARLKRHNSTVAPDDLVVRKCLGAENARLVWPGCARHNPLLWRNFSYCCLHCFLIFRNLLVITAAWPEAPYSVNVFHRPIRENTLYMVFDLNSSH